MKPSLFLFGLLVLGLVCCDSAQAQRLGRSGGYGFNRPTGGYGFNRPTGGYGFNRSVGPAGPGYGVGIVRPGYGYGYGYGAYYGGYNPWLYGGSANWGAPGSYYYGGYGGPRGIWGNSGFSMPGFSTGPATGPKVYQSLIPKPASKGGEFTLPGSSTTLSFPTIKTSRNRSRKPNNQDQ